MTHQPRSDKEPAPIEIVSAQSPLKRADPATDVGRAEVQRIVDQLAAVFVSAVATARGVAPEKVLSDFGRGSLLVGQHAVTAGMADRIGTLESILAGAPGTHRQTRSIAMSDQTPGAPTIDRAFLSTHHPDLLAALIAEGQAQGMSEGLQAGAAAERDRIASVRAQSIPGHEALIEALAFDGHSTGADAAMAVLAAERQVRETAQAAITGRPAAVPAATTPLPQEPTEPPGKPTASVAILANHRQATGARA